MRVIESFQINLYDYKINSNSIVHFLRVDPGSLSISLKNILEKLSELSWLNKFSKDTLKISYRQKAESTINHLEKSLYDDTESVIVEKAGEYIVSAISKDAIVEELNHFDLPLMELLGRKKSGNPGFDYYTEERDNNILFCGEAKYKKGSNPYSSSFFQIKEFIEEKKHVADASLLDELADDTSLDNLVKNIFGISSAFSSTSIETNKLIENIVKNENFINLLEYKNIVLIAVNMP